MKTCKDLLCFYTAESISPKEEFVEKNQKKQNKKQSKQAYKKMLLAADCCTNKAMTQNWM